MEKVVYVLSRPEGVADEEFAGRVLAQAPELAKRGVMKLRIDVVDEHVASGGRLRIGRMDPPKSAVVTGWLHDSPEEKGAVEEVLRALAPGLAGYLVVESVPMHNTEHVAPLGERTPGFNLVTCIEPKAGLAYEDFLSHWFSVHRATAIETQSTFSYVRNEVVRPLTAGAPPWAAVVEEAFPEAALRDPAVFYAAEDAETLKRHTRRMLDSVQAFLALDRVESHPMSEYVFER